MNWTEKINVRKKSTSWVEYAQDWYNVHMTMDLMKIEWSRNITKELKFITPK